jgi:hypothetical protein
MVPGIDPPAAERAGPLQARRCVRHEHRAAAGRCTRCGGEFCRECLATHQHRLLCAPCLKHLLGPASTTSGRGGQRWARLGRSLSTLGALVLAWAVFYGVSSLVVRIPASFHDGSLWSHLGGLEEES